MCEKNTGGPAFPTSDQNYERKCASEGKLLETISLRDYFAAKAMHAAAVNPVGAEGFTFE